METTKRFQYAQVGAAEFRVLLYDLLRIQGRLLFLRMFAQGCVQEAAMGTWEAESRERSRPSAPVW